MIGADRGTIGRTAGYVVSVGSLGIALAFGSRYLELAAYVLAILLGVTIYVHANRYGTSQTYSGAIVGYLGGIVLSEAVITGMVTWYFAVPIDTAAWIMGIRLLFGWAALLFCLLTGFFVAGLGQMLE